jgi:hypothetical protein
MITSKNYFDKVNKIDLSKLPAELKKSHAFVEKATKKGSNWTLYETNEAIKKTIDLHFSLVGELSEFKEKTSEKQVLVPKGLARKYYANFLQRTNGKGKVEEEIYSNLHISDIKAALEEIGRKKGLGLQFRTSAYTDQDGEKSPLHFVQIMKHDKPIGRLFVHENSYTSNKNEILGEPTHGFLNRLTMAGNTVVEAKKKPATVKKNESPKSAKAKKPTATAKAAPKRATKPAAKKAEKPATKETGKKVAHLSEELRIIRRFVNYDGKIIAKKTLLNFLKTIQKAITERKIRKSSKNGMMILQIQDNLMGAFAKMKDASQDNIEFTFDGSWGKELKELASKEVVYNSIPLIKRFIGMMGEKPSLEKVERLKKAIVSSMEAKKVTASDIYYKQLKEILDTIEDYIKGKRSNLKINKAHLSGFEENINNLVKDTEIALEEVEKEGK